MKHFLAALFLLIASCVPSQAFFGGASAWSTFYIDSASGSDSNNGLTPATAWQTTTKLNAQTFAANTRVFLNGTFNVGIVLTIAVAPVNITIASSGGVPATINSGNSTDCIKATNIAAVTLRGVTCTGGGTTTNNTAGLNFINSLPGNAKLAGPVISSVVVSDYGLNCIDIVGSNGTAGFSAVSIVNPAVHDCTGNDPSGGTACINVRSPTGYGFGTTAPAHFNVSVTGFTVYNCNGKAGTTNWTGSGVVVSQTKGIYIGVTPSIVHDFGANNNFASGGPIGAWIFDADCDGGGISRVEAYNGRSATLDGGGFDLDGGTINCIVEKNKAHKNKGYGFLALNYVDTPTLPWGNNTFRFNVSQNNEAGEFGFAFPQAATGALYVYGNTFVNQIPGNGTVIVGSAGTTTISGKLANNIISGIPGGRLINIPVPSSLTFTGNDYWNYATASSVGTTTITWNGVDYTGTGSTGMATAFAAWQTATGQEKISGSNVGLTVNPQIYVPGGLFVTDGYNPPYDMANNLQSGSPMIGAGLNLTTQFGIDPGPTDYYGVAITAAALPVGAAKGDFTTFTASSIAASNFLARVTGFSKFNNVNYNSILSSGAFANFDLLYMLDAPNAAASLLNLMSTSFSLTATGSPTFGAGGYTGNGASSFLNTNWTASTQGVNYTLNCGMHFGYAQIDGQGAAFSQTIYGATNLASNSEASNWPGTDGWYSDVNDFTGITAAVTVTKGLFMMERNTTTLRQWFNGVGRTPQTVASVASPQRPMYLLAYNDGAASLFSTNQLSAVGFGACAQNNTEISQRLNSFEMANVRNQF